METVQQHYDRIRDEITDGCLFLISKDAFVSKVIRWSDSQRRPDKADKSHIGELFIKQIGNRKRIMTLEANQDGLKPHFFSDRLKECDSLSIIKPLCSQDVIDSEMWDSFERASQGVRYDFFNGGKELINRGFGTSMKITGLRSISICSKSVSIKAMNQNMVNMEFGMITLPFPMDYLRHRNINTTELL